jgi:8-oxo-dGTP pyrophosphatase MutT (NUDIX family)
VPVALQNQFLSTADSDQAHWSNSPLKVAAICYRLNPDGEVEFLLVRTARGRWTFPKGGVDGDRSRAAAAAREAYEEAGVRGRIEPSSFTSYLHHKHNFLRRSRGTGVAVEAYLCEVVQLVAPQEFHRQPTWFSPRRAKRRLAEARPPKYAAELERVVDSAIGLIEKRRRLH